MALKNFEASFVSVLPQMRASEEIAADLAASGESASATTRAAMAEIESHLAAGNNDYNQRSYSSALEEFKQARALIYRVLYPGFAVGPFTTKEIALPVSASMENALLGAASKLSDAIRPMSLEYSPVVPSQVQDAIPDGLKAFAGVGFHESASIEEIAQVASAQGVALLQDGKPEAAAAVLEDGLNRAGAQLDASLKAALELNIAAAHLQSGDAPGGGKFAQAALEHFKASQDQVGQAQAVHLSAVSAEKAGNPTAAAQLYQQAADILKRLPGKTPAAPANLPSVPLSSALSNIISRSGVGAVPGKVAVGLAPRVAVRQAVTVSKDTGVLQSISKMNSQEISYRIAGRDNGWGVAPATSDQDRREQAKTWQIGVLTGDTLTSFSVAAGKVPPAADIVARIYQPRITATKISDLAFHLVDTSSTTFYLTHLYAYVLPVKLGDTYHQLGQFAHAEENYLQAAGYTYLNKTLEATSLWVRIARNAVEWGDTVYKSEDLPGAAGQYSKLVTQAGAVPATALYTTASLANPAATARTLIQNLATRPIPELPGEISILVLSAFSKLQQIAQNLDFYGLLLSPIHTFEYLQSVARGFAQEAMQAEEQFINFKSRQEAAEATRRDLEATSAMAHAEADARSQQSISAADDVTAAQRALDLANKRLSDAVAQKAAYAAQSSAEIWAQAASQALVSGQDAMYSEISELADKLARGETISGPGGKLAAAQTLYAGRKTQAYELQKMQDNISELQAAVPIAQAQLASAQARAKAAEIEWQAALQRASLADAALQAFDNDFFTDETWSKMSDVMRDISRSYLNRGIRIAKLMERAYNFENDTNLKVIKQDYGYAVAKAAPGRDTTLLGGDGLLADIESFTYQAITSKTRKSSRIKDAISIATNYPAHFDQFRSTGLLTFETDLYEFDRLHPGFFSQRIEAVELEIIGLLPENGAAEGTLTAGGVSSFRKKDGTLGKRVQVVDTMALSNFNLRGDVFVYSTETGVRGLFQGIGLGTTWELHLPKRANDFDFRRVFDVNFIIYYTATFDNGLRSAVLAKPPKPGELELQRTFALRYDFPDAWYSFYQGGTAKFTLDRVRLPFNQQNFKVKSAQFRVVTAAGVSNQGIALKITGPNAISGVVNTDVNGTVSSADAALAGLAGANPVGDWQVQVTGGASLMDGGVLDLKRVYNIQFGLEYSFEYVPEVL